MDEIELRLAAIETALIEALGLIDPGALADAARSLRERVAEGDPEPDEKAIRLGGAVRQRTYASQAERRTSERTLSPHQSRSVSIHPATLIGSDSRGAFSSA